MNERITAAAGAITALLVGGTAVARAWPARSQQPEEGRVPPLEELLGPPGPYTALQFTDVPRAGVVVQGWRPCAGPCGQEMPSVLHTDGTWQCGHCLTVSGGVS